MSTTSIAQEMELLENHLINDFPKFKQAYLRGLLRILDSFVKTESRRFEATRKLGLPTDGSTILKIVEEVKHCWAHVMGGLNPTDEAFVMGLLEHRDITLADGWLLTPKGQFPVT